MLEAGACYAGTGVANRFPPLPGSHRLRVTADHTLRTGVCSDW